MKLMIEASRWLLITGLALFLFDAPAGGQQSPPRPPHPKNRPVPPEFGESPLPEDPPNYDPIRDAGGVPGVPDPELDPDLVAGPHVGWAATIPTGPARLTVSAGRVFVGTWGGMVHALSASSGAELWQVNVGAPATARPVLAAGRLVVGTNLGNLISVDPSTGARKGVLTGSGAFMLPLVATEEWLVAINSNSRLQFHEASSLRLVRQIRVPGEVQVAPVIAGDVVLLATQQGSVLAYQLEDGVLAWSARLSGQITAPLAVMPGFPSVVVAGTTTGSVVGLDLAMGHELWQHQTAGPYIGGSVSQGRLLLSFKGNTLTELNPVNGREIQPAMISGSPVAPPLFTPSGLAVFLSGGRVDLYSSDLMRLDRVQLPGSIVDLPAAGGSHFYAALREGAVYSLRF